MKKSSENGLTDLESRILSMVWLRQPTTAYQVRNAFSTSPVQENALSQGSIYPAVERLKARGYLEGIPSGDGRHTEHLTCTSAAEEAIKTWLFAVPPLVPPDPLRSRIVVLEILKPSERAWWIKSAKAAVFKALASVEEFSEAYPGEFYDMAHDHARSISMARMRWLVRVEDALPPDNKR